MEESLSAGIALSRAFTLAENKTEASRAFHGGFGHMLTRWMVFLDSIVMHLVHTLSWVVRTFRKNSQLNYSGREGALTIHPRLAASTHPDGSVIIDDQYRT